jgi:5'-methylthioadenosine phosphorylase
MRALPLGKGAKRLSRAIRIAAPVGSMIGIIGGSGLASPTLLSNSKDTFPQTPHGDPSGPVVLARHGRTEVAFIARHGRGHAIPPHRVNHKANLWALKNMGVTEVLATSSVGSLKTPIRPGTFVVPHDYVAFWNVPTFFDEEVRHVTPAMDDRLRKVLVAAARKARARVSARSVYVQATGPRLETKSEIAFFKGIGDVVGMTIASEATLAAELEVPYAALCSVDNYCNGIGRSPLTYGEIVRTQERNAARSEAILAAALEALG